MVGGVDHERNGALRREEDGLREELCAVTLPPVHVDDAGERTLSRRPDEITGNSTLSGAGVGDILDRRSFDELLGAHAEIEGSVAVVLEESRWIPSTLSQDGKKGCEQCHVGLRWPYAARRINYRIMQRERREVVVTGVGLCCNMGSDLERILADLRAGKNNPFQPYEEAVR